MNYTNAYDLKSVHTTLERLNQLTENTQPLWGKMTAAQMLAHLNVSYDLAKGDRVEKIGSVGKFFLKLFVKPMVLGAKPYPKNSRTAPYFLVTEKRDFLEEKYKLIQNIEWTQQQGVAFFEGKDSNSFGKLSAEEWSILFQKHLDHHFSQFGI